MKHLILKLGLLVFVFSHCVAFADEFTELSLEELMNVSISSVSKKPEKLLRTSAAVHVITSEDIRRSGTTHVAELLRMAPGVQVARVDSSRWAVTIRGDNGVFANKLLVLVDGRTIYNPVFAGVLWDELDFIFDDIERIEVIRGPGATLWGANAVNGVINIITKNASEAEGLYFSAGGGSEIHQVGEARYGGKIGDSTNFRLSAKYKNMDETQLQSSRTEGRDSWDLATVSLRTDTQVSKDSSLMTTGKWFHSDSRVPSDGSLPLPERDSHLRGAHYLARYEQKLSEDQSFSTHAYVYNSHRKEAGLHYEVNTYEVDFDHRIDLDSYGSHIWGVKYRHWDDDIDDEFSGIEISDQRRSFDLVSGFIQSEFELIDEKLFLILGTKLEHNDFTGFEYQPSARFRYLPGDNHTVWGAVSRAVRTPSRGQDDVHLPLSVGRTPDGLPFQTVFEGSREGEAENLISFELGYRAELAETVYLDIAAFYSYYDDIGTFELGAPEIRLDGGLPTVVQPLVYDNLATSNYYGGELSLSFTPVENWRVSAWYQLLQESTNLRALSTDPRDLRSPDPEHSAGIRSLIDLPYGFEFDTFARYVDSIAEGSISPYIELDLRIGWQPSDLPIELSVTGRNLLNNSHQEYKTDFLSLPLSRVERSVFGQITWRFN